MNSNLSDTDLATLQSVMLPIMRDVPGCDNPKAVMVAVLMAASTMAEQVYFGSPGSNASWFPDVETLYDKFEEARQAGDVREACIQFIESITPEREPAQTNPSSTSTPSLWEKIKTYL